jgi:hypothetical protein
VRLPLWDRGYASFRECASSSKLPGDQRACLRSVSFGVHRRTYEPRLQKGRGHTLIVALKLPARPRLYQVLEERYLLVFGELAFLVSNEPIHQSQNPPPMSLGYPLRAS